MNIKILFSIELENSYLDYPKRIKNGRQDEINLEKYEKEKREILELYNKVKNGKVNIYSISEDKIIKINELLKTEIELENERIGKIRTEVRRIQDETKAIEHETKNIEYGTKKCREKIEYYKKMIEEKNRKSVQDSSNNYL